MHLEKAADSSQATLIARPTKTVIIVGGAAKEKKMPWDNTGVEFWGLNAIRPDWMRNRWTRWFNLHRYAHLQRDWAEGVEREIQWANQNPKVPFYVLDDWTNQNIALLPNRVIFPYHMGYPRDTYHAGSFDMLVAFALFEGFSTIHLRGVKLGDPHAEPISARACLEYWIGFAEARGVTVTVGDDCELLAQYHLVKSHTTYGWDDVKLIEER